MNSSALEKNIEILLAESETESFRDDELSDKHLITLVLSGDEEAFETLFEKYKRLAGSVAVNYFRQTHQVEEIIQKTFVKVYFELKSFRGDHRFSFASWVSKIAVNVCLDTLRSEKRRNENEILELTESEYLSLNSIVDSTELELINQDLAGKLLAKLEAEDRMVLQMLDGEERSVREVAELTGWSLAKVKVRAYRARKSLRKILKRLL
jgi:RNA polymerase sigma-70 factor (ECF subfamily)